MISSSDPSTLKMRLHRILRAKQLFFDNMKVAIAVICAIAAVGSAAAASGNMNGKYSVATGAGKQDAPWNDDYASKG